MRVVGYVRVSTTEQVAGQGLGVQEAAIRKWAKAGGHKLVGMFSDEGQSGSNGIDTRVGLADALGAVTTGAAGGIVVYRLDRLARDLVLQEQLLAEVALHGGRLHSTSPAEDDLLSPDGAEADPSRALVRQILGAVASYERQMIRLRMSAGKRRKVEAGGYGGGQPGFGWRAVNGALEPDEAEQVVLARIMDMKAAGASTRAIAAELNAEGHPTRRGGQWSNVTVGGILRREAGDRAT